MKILTFGNVKTQCALTKACGRLRMDPTEREWTNQSNHDYIWAFWAGKI